MRFSGELSLDLPKLGYRFVTEMIYGIQARQSVRLSEVGRALREETPIKKIVERLGRQLRRPDLASHLTNRLLRAAESQLDASSRLIPIYARLYSQNAPDHISENEEVTNALNEVTPSATISGIRVAIVSMSSRTREK